MKIEEYWTRLVGAGLAPKWRNVWGRIKTDGCCYTISFYDDTDVTNLIKITTFECYTEGDEVQLRKDGMELYPLY